MGVFCQPIFWPKTGAKQRLRRKKPEFQDRQLHKLVARRAFSGRLAREHEEGLKRLRTYPARQRRRLRQLPICIGLRGCGLPQLWLHERQALQDGFEPFLCLQRRLQSRLLLGDALQDCAAQIVQQVAGGPAARDPAVPAEAWQEKFIGIIVIVRLRPQKGCKRRLLPRAVPALTERAAQADIAFQHPRGSPAGQRIDPGICFAERLVEQLRIRLHRRCGRGRRRRLRLFRKIGQDIRQQLRLQGVRLRFCPGRRFRRRFFLPLLSDALRQRAQHDHRKPAHRDGDGDRQAVGRQGETDQDQKKADDDILD